MKKLHTWRVAAVTLAATALLVACGGGGDDFASNAAVNQYASGLAQSGAALASAAPQAFASSYLDAGMTRTQLVEALQQDAAAAGSDVSFSGFPAGSLTDVTMTNCNEKNVCTLSGTLTNSDADTISVAFSTQVVLENGSYRLFGDQQAS